MEFGPIFRALLRNKTGAILIALQIAFTMAVSVNAWVMIKDRLDNASRPSGMNETDTFHLQSYGFDPNFKPKLTIANDLRQLRELAGVIDAIQMNAIPLSGSGSATGVRASRDENAQSFNTAVYQVDDHAIDTLGVNLLAGENFTATDITTPQPFEPSGPPKAIITLALASALFPEGDPLSSVGRTIIIGDSPSTVVGVIERLQSPWTDSNSVERSMLIPVRTDAKAARYMIRSQPGQRDSLMPRIEEMLAASNPERIIRNLRSMEETRRRSYSLDMGLAKIMGFVMIVLLGITALGILGLASFSVNRRTKQIGVRRALGATTGDILRYFLLENVLITSTGVLLGAIMTVGLNIWLVEMMNFPKIAWYGIPLGVIVLVALGQLAVLGPANRACRVSPATATRTV